MHFNGCDALAPPVAGGIHPHQAGVLAVLHEPHQDALLDQGLRETAQEFFVKENLQKRLP
jgi:hypothetical protein